MGARGEGVKMRAWWATWLPVRATFPHMELRPAYPFLHWVLTLLLGPLFAGAFVGTLPPPEAFGEVLLFSVVVSCPVFLLYLFAYFRWLPAVRHVWLAKVLVCVGLLLALLGVRTWMFQGQLGFVFGGYAAAVVLVGAVLPMRYREGPEEVAR